MNKIKEEKKEKTETPTPTEPKDPVEEKKTTVGEEVNVDPEEENNIIEVLQNAGVYRRENLLRQNAKIDLLKKINDNLDFIVEKIKG